MAPPGGRRPFIGRVTLPYWRRQTGRRRRIRRRRRGLGRRGDGQQAEEAHRRRGLAQHHFIAVYIARLDAVQGVRQAAVEVWKTVVPNTPRMLREVLETLVRRLVAMLTPVSSSQDDAERLQGAQQPVYNTSDDEDGGRARGRRH